MSQISSIPSEYVEATVRNALEEDVGSGDLTATLIPESRIAAAHIVTRDDAVLCGTDWANTVFRRLDPRIAVRWTARDGDEIQAGQMLCRLDGPARGLLTGERTALNFLQLLCAAATAARRYVEAVRGTATVILDTRKTLPGLRLAQKYAVRCGGARNHRIGLYDGILIKENHIAAAGSIDSAVRAAQARAPAGVFVEIEVEDLNQLNEALAAGAKRVLIDNFSLHDIRRAVALTRGRAEIEVSGGITLATIRALAETGVDYISTGDITKNVHAVDLSMRFESPP